MSGTTRIPRAEITGIYGAIAKRFSKRMLGQVPEPLWIYWQNRPVLKGYFAISGKARKWDACDPSLKSFAHMAVASLVGCTWCLDFGYFQAHNEHLDLQKAREVPRWRESDAFTTLERDVMAYAEAMSQTPPAVTDEMSAGLLEQLGAAAMVELTAFISLANFYARTNVAFGIESDGFAAACGLQPLAEPTPPRGWYERRPVRHPPKPALHRRLRDARLRRRCRGRGAGDVAAVGRRRSGGSARPACLPRPDRHPAGAQPAAEARTGEIGSLLDVLAPDLVMVSDGGGVAAAARKPVEGAKKVAAFLTGLGRIAPDFSATAVRINGAPALVIEIPGEVATAITATTSEGRVTRIYAMRNPHKLGRIADETALSRERSGALSPPSEANRAVLATGVDEPV